MQIIVRKLNWTVEEKVLDVEKCDLRLIRYKESSSFE